MIYNDLLAKIALHSSYSLTTILESVLSSSTVRAVYEKRMEMENMRCHDDSIDIKSYYWDHTCAFPHRIVVQDETIVANAVDYLPDHSVALAIGNRLQIVQTDAKHTKQSIYQHSDQIVLLGSTDENLMFIDRSHHLYSYVFALNTVREIGRVSEEDFSARKVSYRGRSIDISSFLNRPRLML